VPDKELRSEQDRVSRNEGRFGLDNLPVEMEVNEVSLFGRRSPVPSFANVVVVTDPQDVDRRVEAVRLNLAPNIFRGLTEQNPATERIHTYGLARSIRAIVALLVFGPKLSSPLDINGNMFGRHHSSPQSSLQG
jgi:hypothetical protein